MTVSQLASPLALNTITPGTEEDAWGEPVNDNWVMIRQSVVDLLADLANKADLDGSGKILTSQMPPLNAIAVTPVADQTARLALSSATVGTAVLQNDNGNIYVLTATPPSTNGNWSPVNPGTSVVSINGETGSVTGYVKTSTNSQTVTATGFTFSNPVTVADATGSGHAVNKGQLDTAISGVSGGGGITRSSFLLGNGSATSFNVDHNKSTLGVMVFAQDVDSGDRVEVGVNYFSVNRVVITTATAPATNKLRVWCI